MNTLEEEKYIRAERHRKQDLYRLMLDQQVSQRQPHRYLPAHDHNYKQSQLSLDKREQPYADQNNYRNRYFPTINDDRKVQPSQDRGPKLSSTHLNSDLDNTQIYLSNCEEIIKNLRELKRKKKQKEASLLSPEPSFPPERDDRHKVSVQYFPRTNYFTSQGTAYNKNVPSNSNIKYPKNRDRLRTLEDSADGSFDGKTQQTPKKNVQLRKRQVPEIKNKGYSLDKYTFSNKFQENGSDREQRQEYETPSGLRETASLQPVSKASPIKNIRQKHKFRQSQSSQQQPNPNKATSPSKQKEKDGQDKIKQKNQLSECLAELTKFLKNQNKEREISQQNSQAINGSKVSTSEISIQASFNPENRSETGQNSAKPHEQVRNGEAKNQNNSEQHNFNRLKVKAIEALKQLNKKSEEFANVASRRPEKVASKRSSSPIDSYQQNSDSNRSSLAMSRKEEKSNAAELTSEDQKPLASKNFKKIFSIQKQYSLRSTDGRQIQESQIRKGDKDSELISLLMRQLERQEGQNEELSYCLKELTAFLRDQNQEMDALKKSREGSTSENQHLQNSAQSVSDLNEIEEEEQETQAENQQKLQQTVVNRLKKARMKGSIFKEKVENFRKQHLKMNLLSHTHKKQSEKVKGAPQEETGVYAKEQPISKQEEAGKQKLPKDNPSNEPPAQSLSPQNNIAVDNT